MANIQASDVHSLTTLKVSPAEAITEFPGEDDWQGWVDLLDRFDTGTIDCVPACMRPSVEGFIGPDGRLNDPDIVPDTPYGVAKFVLPRGCLPWRSYGLSPAGIRTLLDQGFAVKDIEETAKALYAEDEASRELQREARELAIQRGRSGDLDLYFIRSQAGPIKIGVSTDPQSRLRHLQTGHPFKLELLCVVPSAGKQENAYHKRFATHRLHGE